MKKAFRFFSLALALLMLFPIFSPLRIKVSATEPAQLSVVSYNIEFLTGNPDPNRNAWLAPATLWFWGIDIVGLQEVEPGWDSILTTYMSGYSRVQGDTTCETWPEIFYKSTRFNKLNSGCKHYSLLYHLYPNVPTYGADPSRDTKSRMFTWALLQHIPTGKRLLVISTHLHYRAGSQFTQDRDADALVRNHEIRLMLAWINTQTFVYDALVVLGDMNTHYLSGRGKTTINIFKNEGGFAVARDSAQTKGDIGGTCVNDKAPGTRNLRSEFIFDYILTRGNVETTFYTVLDNILDHGGTSYPSDHMPVWADILVY